MIRNPLPSPQMRNGGFPPAHLPSSPHSDPMAAILSDLKFVAAIVSDLKSSLVVIAASAEKVLAEEKHRHEMAALEKALADDANKQHQAAAQEKALADKANEQRRAAAREKALADEANEQRQAAAQEKALADEATEQRQAAAREKALADEANERRQAAARKKALAKDMRRPEETAAIRHIRVECALLAAPLDAILAEIECDNIAHEARAPPTTTLPHSAAILSTPPRPMTYVGVVLSTMGGSSQATFLPLAQAALPSPAVDG
jgi:hypothetical protein